MNEWLQGLQVSVLGLLITFLALGLFVLVMVLLKRLFPAEIRPDEPAGNPQTHIQKPGEAELAAVAAAAAALYRKSKMDPNLGRLLEQPKGAWWSTRGKSTSLPRSGGRRT